MTQKELHPLIEAQLKAAQEAEVETRLQSPGHYSALIGLNPEQPTPFRVRLDLMQRHAGNFRPGAPKTPILRSVVVAVPGCDGPDEEITERLRRTMEADVIASKYLDNMTQDNLRTDPEKNGDLTTPGWWIRATHEPGAPLEMRDLRALWNMAFQIEGRGLLNGVRQLMRVELTPRESLHVEAGMSRIVMRQFGWKGKQGSNEFFFMLSLRPEAQTDEYRALEHYSDNLQNPEVQRDYPEDNHLLPFLVGWTNGSSLVEAHTVLADMRAEAEKSLRLYDSTVRAMTALDHRGSTYEQLRALLDGTARYVTARNGSLPKESKEETFQDYMLGRNETPEPGNLN